MYNLDFAAFRKLTEQGNLIPLYREILADRETPVGVLEAFADKPHLFLLESVEGAEKWARYSFIGFDPHAIIKVDHQALTIREGDREETIVHNDDPLGIMRDYLQKYRPVLVPGLPRFFGGAVGFFTYEMAAYFDRGIKFHYRDDNVEKAIFFITDTLLIFDRIRHTLKILSLAYCREKNNLEAEYKRCLTQIEAVVDRLNQTPRRPQKNVGATISLSAAMSRDKFMALVEKAREYIHAGEAIQVVISQKFVGTTELSGLTLYRALRFVNPSPYLFFFRHDGLTLIGSSPETMVRLTEGVVELRPIAGTRPRGRDDNEDQRLADELLSDEKEKAEHVMLVDLGRNDLGRISRTGTVQVNQLMVVERYSHVMHLVSHISSQLEAGKDAFDVIKATFPAGTLSGAPKIRAMEIIAELEEQPRGPYGGAIGYFSFNGNMDFGIIIRTLVQRNREISIQAGAGIVSDSDPEQEYAETLNKAKGMLRALEFAAGGLDLTGF